MRLSKNLASCAVIFEFFTISIAGGCAKNTPKVYHIGILSGLSYFYKTASGFKEKMGELGYIEGKNVIYEEQKTNFDVVAYRNILRKFISDHVDLIFVYPTEASMEAKVAAQGTSIPVLFADASIEDTGLVTSVQAPGGNITGVRWPGPDLAVKIFEIMHELVPDAKRICVPYQKGYPIANSQLAVLRPEASSAGVALIEAPASGPTELAEFFAARERAKDVGIDAIIDVPDPLIAAPGAFSVLCKFANKYRLPIGGTLYIESDCESLFGVNVNPDAVGRQAAVLADRILKGESAGTIRVISSESYFQFNYRAAARLKLKVSEGLLSTANEVLR
jgi:putative ABC transport system substrate-binding protein